MKNHGDAQKPNKQLDKSFMSFWRDVSNDTEGKENFCDGD